MLQVILPPDVMATVARLAKLQSRSRSAVARDFLVEVAPILARVATTLEAAKAMDATGRARLVANLEAVQDSLEHQARQLTLKLDRATRTAKRPGSGSRRRAERAAPRPRRTVLPPNH